MSCQGCLFKIDYGTHQDCNHPAGPDIDYGYSCQNKYDILEEAALVEAAERFRP